MKTSKITNPAAHKRRGASEESPGPAPPAPDATAS